MEEAKWKEEKKKMITQWFFSFWFGENNCNGIMLTDERSVFLTTRQPEYKNNNVLTASRLCHLLSLFFAIAIIFSELNKE